MSKPKRTVKYSIRLRAYTVVSNAILAGIKYGVNRAYKHTETPTRDALEEAVELAVMNELCDVLNFDEVE